MNYQCSLDNCPHHAAKNAPIEKVGTVCSLKQCAWDAPTMTEYFNRVREGIPNPEAALPLEIQSCSNSQEENT